MRARLGDKWFVVNDGKESKAFDHLAGGILFSPDSRRFAYSAAFGDKCFVVVDDKDGKSYERIGLGTLRFSPDSRRLAYAAKNERGLFVIADGIEYKPYDNIGGQGVSFSPDSKHLAYVAHKFGHQFVVVDEVEGKEYDAIVARGGRIVFDSSQSFHYLAQSSGSILSVSESLRAKPQFTTALTSVSRVAESPLPTRWQPYQNTDGIEKVKPEQKSVRSDLVKDSFILVTELLEVTNPGKVLFKQGEKDGTICAVFTGDLVYYRKDENWSSCMASAESIEIAPQLQISLLFFTAEIKAPATFQEGLDQLSIKFENGKSVHQKQVVVGMDLKQELNIGKGTVPDKWQLVSGSSGAKIKKKGKELLLLEGSACVVRLP